MQSQLANVKRENAQCKKYADDLEKAMILSEARHSSEIETLSKKIEEFETLIAAQRLEIMEIKDNCQNDHETNNHNTQCDHFGRFYNRSKMRKKRSENDKRTI